MKKQLLCSTLLCLIFLCLANTAYAQPNKQYYWKGSTGDFNDPNMWWVDSYGSGTTATQAPNSTNSVFFTAAAFAAPNVTITVNANSSCDSLIWDNGILPANTPILNGSSNVSIGIYGSFALADNLDFQYQGMLRFRSQRNGIETLDPRGKMLRILKLDIDGSANTEFQLLSKLHVEDLNNSVSNLFPTQGGFIELLSGTFNTNGQDVSVDFFHSKNNNPDRGLLLTNSRIEIDGYHAQYCWRIDFNSTTSNYSTFDANRNVDVMNWFVSDHHQSNPYWLLNKETQGDRFRRAIANLTTAWDISEHFNFQVRMNYDFAKKRYDERRQAGGNTTTVAKNGRWIYSDYVDSKAYMDGILSYNNTFGDFNLTALAGATYQRTKYNDGVAINSGMQDNGLFFANEFNFQNTGPTTQIRSTLSNNVEKQSLFGNVEIGWKEMIFVDIAGRNDWASTLALTGNDSYFYPSFGISTIFSEMFDLPEDISFLKARFSVATIGNEVPWNRINPANSVNNTGTVITNTVKPFLDAKPELISTREFGLDLRMFNNRLGIDFTSYKITSKDQFLRFPLESQLYTSEYINAGEIENKGVEISLTGKPIVNEDFSWSTILNYTKNKNKIIELSPNALDAGLGGTEGFAAPLIEGGSFGDIWGFEFQRDDQGRILLDPATGGPLPTADRALLGNAEPDFALGWSNTLNYKAWSMNIQLNGKFGGIVASQTESLLDGNGVSKRSGDARDRGFVKINGSLNGTAVTEIDPLTYYSEGPGTGGRNGIPEAYVWSRTNVRLAQLSLSYNFNVDKLDWLKGASLSFIGNNLFRKATDIEISI